MGYKILYNRKEVEKKYNTNITTENNIKKNSITAQIRAPDSGINQ